RYSTGSPRSRSRKGWSGPTAGSRPSLRSAGSWRSRVGPRWWRPEVAVSLRMLSRSMARVRAGVGEAADVGGHEFPLVTVVVQPQKEHSESAFVSDFAVGRSAVER